MCINQYNNNKGNVNSIINIMKICNENDNDNEN